MTLETAAHPDQPTSPAYRWRWVVLAIILTAEIMDLLDSSIVNLAATPIARDLGGGSSTVQWVVGGYTLAFAVALVVGGRLGDKLGRKHLFVIGAAGFTVASLACALAQGPTFLIVARILQGFIGALLIPQGFGIMKEVFPPAELGKAFSTFGPVIGLSAVIGPLLGGVLVDADLFGLGWRVVFLINVPVGVVAVGLALRFMPRSARNPDLRLDPLGVGLLAAASVLLIFPLIQGRDLDWPWWTFAAMALSVPMFAIFGWHERHGAHPLIEPTLLRNRAYLAGIAVIMLGFAALIGASLVFNVFTQAVLGYSPLRAAFAGCTFAVGMAIAATLGGAVLVPRFGRSVLSAGFVLMMIGAGLVALTVQLGGLEAHAWQFLPAQLVFGFGAGLAIIPVFNITLAGVSDHEVGSASGVLNALQQLGGTTGVAVSGTLFFSWLPKHGPLPAMEVTVCVSAVFALAALVLVRLLPARARGNELP
jgi:EmrB/QacA subfamily drug resistance transporter